MVSKIGQTKALDILLTARILSAKECFDIGLVQHIITSNEMYEETINWLEPRIQLHHTVIQAYKKVISSTYQTTFYDALEYEKNRFIPFWGGKINMEALSKRIKHV